MTKEIMSPPGLESGRGVGDGEVRSVLSPVTDCPSPSGIRDGLLRKRDNVSSQLATLDEERKQIAYFAHVEGGEAEKKLPKLNKDRLALLGDLETFEAALAEASRRVEAAECEAEQQRAEEAALKAMAVADKLIEVGEKLDAQFAKASKISHEFWAIIEELGALQCGRPTYEAFKVQCGLASLTHLMNGRFRAEHLAPRDRRTFAELAQRLAHDGDELGSPTFTSRDRRSSSRVIAMEKVKRGQSASAPWMGQDSEIAHNYAEFIGHEHAKLRARLHKLEASKDNESMDTNTLALQCFDTLAADLRNRSLA